MAQIASGQPAPGRAVRRAPGLGGEALERCQRLKDELEILGFSFHLTSPSWQLRLAAAARLMELLEDAQSRGMPACVLNVGGFRVNFLASGEDSVCFVEAIESSLLGGGDAVTWRGHSYGLRAEGEVVRGRSQLSRSS
jgi:diaminopimelate decarboxylase